MVVSVNDTAAPAPSLAGIANGTTFSVKLTSVALWGETVFAERIIGPIQLNAG